MYLFFSIWHFFSPVGMQSVAVSMSVCLFVCLSTHISQKPRNQILQNFPCMLLLAMARFSSDKTAICCILLISLMLCIVA